jgi:hypothetical protein
MTREDKQKMEKIIKQEGDQCGVGNIAQAM